MATEHPRPNGAANPTLPGGDHQADQFDLSKYAYVPVTTGAVRREQLTIPEGRPRDVFFRIDPRDEGACRKFLALTAR